MYRSSKLVTICVLLCAVLLTEARVEEVCKLPNYKRPVLELWDGYPSSSGGVSKLNYAVKQLQGLLNKHGGYGLTVDGYFGRQTEYAVRDWEKRNQLEVNGIVGPNTWPTLCVDHSNVCLTRPTLRLWDGYQGREHLRDAVRGLQQLLKDRGYDITVDGYYGPETEKQVKKWERRHGLEQNGIVGPNTWPSLCYGVK